MTTSDSPPVPVSVSPVLCSGFWQKLHAPLALQTQNPASLVHLLLTGQHELCQTWTLERAVFNTQEE